MSRKVGIVNIEVRFCGECPFMQYVTTPSVNIGSDLRNVPTLPGQPGGPLPNVDVGWMWVMCTRLGQQITNMKERLGDCPLVEIKQFQKELEKNPGDPKNWSPHQVGKGPTD